MVGVYEATGLCLLRRRPGALGNSILSLKNFYTGKNSKINFKSRYEGKGNHKLNSFSGEIWSGQNKSLTR